MNSHWTWWNILERGYQVSKEACWFTWQWSMITTTITPVYYRLNGATHYALYDHLGSNSRKWMNFLGCYWQVLYILYIEVPFRSSLTALFSALSAPKMVPIDVEFTHSWTMQYGTCICCCHFEFPLGTREWDVPKGTFMAVI